VWIEYDLRADVGRTEKEDSVRSDLLERQGVLPAIKLLVVQGHELVAVHNTHTHIATHRFSRTASEGSQAAKISVK
jgi:hypothetical protein